MEYYIYVTKNCNYQCKYCDVLSIAKQSGSSKTTPNIHETVNYVLGDKHCKNEEKTIVFYGGEPLMDQSFIRDFMAKTQGQGLKYLLHTNGSLLNQVDSQILKSLDYIFVSIDGDLNIQDNYRGGQGSFDAIMKNVLEIKPLTKASILARITIPLSYNASISRAILGVINSFDYVYCQIENDALTPSCGPLGGFKNHFAYDLKELIEYWMDAMRKGIVKNIVPFQAIVSALLFQRLSEGRPADASWCS